MKKILTLTLAAFAMANAVFAQTEAKDAAWAAKEAAKAKKVQDAADLKAFKEKQKAELAAFIEAWQKGNQHHKLRKARHYKCRRRTGLPFWHCPIKWFERICHPAVWCGRGVSGQVCRKPSQSCQWRSHRQRGYGVERRCPDW